ncbi:Chromosome partition protein MukB [Rhizoctonia solani]|uniref:Chromosome partition protein MukB n=1 Tax=Rhizoctonia solani TaxID=456999 RepID=A0A0K6G7H2_9AGAM|nr:Chromosome partition protein MukB [Rhizoctonia solani]
MSSGEADRLTHGIHGLMIDNSEPSGGSDTQATLAQKDRSHTAASGRAKQSTETLDRNNVGHVGQKTGSAMTAIQDKWNELTDKMGSGSLKDLKELKKDIEKIVTQIEQHHISFPDDRTLSLDMLRKLHSLLGQLIMHTGDINMISLAIRVSKGALDLIYPGDVQIVTWSNNLGNSYWRRFRSLGVPNDLDMALVYYTQAREHFPRGSQALHSVLFNLANCYLDRFQSRGAPLDLDEAVELYHEALSLVPHGAPETSSHLNGIANALYQRFQLRNERKDLDEAIEYQEKAVNLSNQGDIHSPGWFGNLGNLYQARFELSGKLEDVHRAIDYISRAISRASDKHPSLPGLLRTLGSSYRLRYDRLGIENDINKALEVHTRMLSLTPEGHRELPGRLVALGESYSSRYQQTEQQQDVVSAIDLTHRALLLVPERDPKQPEYYFSISQLYIMRFNSAGTVKDIDNAVDHLHRGLILLPRGHIIASKLLDALGAAYFRRYLRLNINEDIEKSIKFHQEAVQSSRTNLPGPLMNLGNAYCERFNKLNTKNDIESAIDYQARALELLPDRHSSKPGVLMNLGTSYQKRFDHYHDQADIIVAISYLSEALLLASETQLTNARERLLKSLQNWNVRDRGVRVKGSVRPKQKDEFAYILTLLWKCLAKPVLDSLGLQPKPGANDLPRITWCTTGILSFLPLHAAGDYECEDARLFNYAISSYTPTLSGLLKPTPKLDVVATHPTMLVVGQEHTPGQSPLPGTKEEIKCIESHIQSLPCYTKLQDEDATPDNVLTCMEQSDWVHLACHARQDNINPALSGFLLHGSTLSLNLIAQRDSIQNKGLAFLSACQTATGDENLPDEAAHLAAGMLTVGYRSVIATMWSIMDADAPLIADRVYARLLDGKDEIPGQRDTARALHYAIEELRREVGEEAFSRWVPFVHIGVLKVKKPTGGRTAHPFYVLAHAVSDDLNKVHGTVSLNDKLAEVEAELKESIADVFEVAKALLRGLEDRNPVFNKDFEPLEQSDKKVEEEGEEVAVAEDGEERKEADGPTTSVRWNLWGIEATRWFWWKNPNSYGIEWGHWTYGSKFVLIHNKPDSALHDLSIIDFAPRTAMDAHNHSLTPHRTTEYKQRLERIVSEGKMLISAYAKHTFKGELPPVFSDTIGSDIPTTIKKGFAAPAESRLPYRVVTRPRFLPTCEDWSIDGNHIIGLSPDGRDDGTVLVYSLYHNSDPKVA